MQILVFESLVSPRQNTVVPSASRLNATREKALVIVTNDTSWISVLHEVFDTALVSFATSGTSPSTLLTNGLCRRDKRRV